MEAGHSSETSTYFYQSTPRDVSDNDILQSHRGHRTLYVPIVNEISENTETALSFLRTEIHTLQYGGSPTGRTGPLNMLRSSSASLDQYSWLQIIHKFMCASQNFTTLCNLSLWIYFKEMPCANRGPLCALENCQWCGEPCFAGAAISLDECLPRIPRRDRLPM
jgi:hypothetical protein